MLEKGLKELEELTLPDIVNIVIDCPENDIKIEVENGNGLITEKGNKQGIKVETVSVSAIQGMLIPEKDYKRCMAIVDGINKCRVYVRKLEVVQEAAKIVRAEYGESAKHLDEIARAMQLELTSLITNTHEGIIAK